MKKPAPTKSPPKKKSLQSPGPASPRSSSAQTGGEDGPSSGGEDLPGKEEIASLQAAVRAFMHSAGQKRVRGFLERLSLSPPQVLLLEGGTADERLAAAHYWALLLNCPAVSGNARPAREKPPVHNEDAPPPGSLADSRSVADSDQAGTAALPPPPVRSAPPASEQGGLLSLLPDFQQSKQAAKAPRTAPLSLGLPGITLPEPAPSPRPEHPEQPALPLMQDALLPMEDARSADEDAGPQAELPAAAIAYDMEAANGAFPERAFPQPDASAKNHPCLVCPECIRMLTHLHRDCFFLDGFAGSIKTDDVRAVRAVLGEPPREARRRIVIFREAQSLVEAAANALLKSFEEPRPGTSFVMLAPQRERLLPTLVSRSVVLTLPWPCAQSPEQRDRLAPWEAALCVFLQNGRDFFERSGAKGAVDAPLVHDLTNLCRRALARRLTAQQCGTIPGEGLESIFARMPLQRLRMLDEALAECQDSLIYNVNPTLVLEWLATRMYLLLPRVKAGF